MNESMKKNRIPVSTKRTGCVPFNVSHKSDDGYNVGENPIKPSKNFVVSYEEALNILRSCDCAGWRNYGSGSKGSARKSIGWVTEADSKRLLAEVNDKQRVALYELLSDVVE
jgi:hypothetical protein